MGATSTALRGHVVASELTQCRERGTPIGGRVVDEAGNPVANFQFDLYLHRQGDPDPRARHQWLQRRRLLAG